MLMPVSGLTRWLCVVGCLSAWATGCHAFDLQAEVSRAIAAGGGEVIVPPGEHILKSPLVIKDADKLDIVGYDQERCVLRIDSSEAAIVDLLGKCSKVRLRKLTLDGGQKTPTGIRIGKPAEKAPSASEVEVSDCILQGFAKSALEIYAAETSTVERCTFMDIAGPSILLSAPTRSTNLKHNHFTRSPLAVQITGVEECGVLFNEIRDCSVGIRSEGGRSNRLIGNQLFQISADGIELLPGTTAYEVSSNELDDIGGTGVLLSGSGHRVKGNEISAAKSGVLEIREGKHQLEPPHDADAR